MPLHRPGPRDCREWRQGGGARHGPGMPGMAGMALSAGKGGASGLGSTGLNYGVKGETGEAEILKVFKYTGEAKGHGASGRPRSSTNQHKARAAHAVRTTCALMCVCVCVHYYPDAHQPAQARYIIQRPLPHAAATLGSAETPGTMALRWAAPCPTPPKPRFRRAARRCPRARLPSGDAQA